MPTVESALPSLDGSDCDQHSHAVRFYSEDASLVDALRQSLVPILAAGHSAVVIGTAEHRRALARALGASGVSVPKLAQAGRYAAEDAAETLSHFMLDGRPDAARFSSYVEPLLERTRRAARDPQSSVFVFGEMVALLWAEREFEAALQLERLWNGLSQTNSFHLHCAYPVGTFNGPGHEAAFARMCTEHTGVLPIGVPTLRKRNGDGDGEGKRLSKLAFWQQRARLEVETAGREKLRSALRSREDELVDLLENGVESIQRTGPDKKVSWTNKALLKLLGYASGEYVGHRFSDFFVHADAAQELWARLMKREEVHDFAAEMRCKDGTVKHVLIQSNGLWDGERFVHSRTFLHDVTERMQMEQALLRAHEELEIRVAERTAELREKNQQISLQAEELDRTNRGLRELSVRVLRAQDDERRRIARDLHDGTGQELALLSMNLSSMEGEAQRQNSALQPELADSAAIVRRVCTQLRTLSYLLHPPLLDEMGLNSALRWCVDGFGQRSGIRVSLELPEDLGRLEAGLEVAIFRVVQECLTNIHRHSGSATAGIRLKRTEGKVILKITDNGKGIPAEKIQQISSVGTCGVGLRGIRERIKDFGGEMEVTANGKGTQIRVVLPAMARCEQELSESAGAAG